MRGKVIAFAAALAGMLAAPARGQLVQLPAPAAATGPSATGKFSVRALASVRTVRPGDSLHVAIEMTVAPTFWLYGPVPGGRMVQPRPLTIEPADSPLPAGEVLFPPPRPHTGDLGDGQSETYNVYEGAFRAYLPLTVPAGTAPGRYELAIRVQAQVCDPNVCLLPSVTVPAVVAVAGATVPSAEWTGEVASGLAEARTAGQWREILGTGKPLQVSPAGAVVGPPLHLGAALGLAFLAGLILNIMPCVLPVIPLKVLSIIQQARQSPRRFVTLGLAFAGGIVLFFVALAAANVLLKGALGYTYQWGDHFRHLWFVVGMTLVLVALAVNLFGGFVVTVPGPLAGGQPGEGHAGAVGIGFLTAVLSTPCSFAILTSAFLWAQGQPLWLGSIAIVVIGLGMAAPYALLTALPRLVARVPRAGRWSELFKQSMGFVVLLVAVWVLSVRMEEKYPAWVAGYAVVLAFCLWMWGSWVRYDSPPARKWTVRLLAAVLAVAAGWWMLSGSRPLAVAFEPFDAARIAQARAAGRIVLVDFTADWCMTCKYVERTVYNDRQVARALSQANVLAIKGDVTTADRPAAALQKELGEPAVPVTVLLPPGDGPPVRLRGVFGKGDLLKALDRIAGAR